MIVTCPGGVTCSDTSEAPGHPFFELYIPLKFCYIVLRYHITRHMSVTQHTPFSPLILIVPSHAKYKVPFVFCMQMNTIDQDGMKIPALLVCTHPCRSIAAECGTRAL